MEIPTTSVSHEFLQVPEPDPERLKDFPSLASKVLDPVTGYGWQKSPCDITLSSAGV